MNVALRQALPQPMTPVTHRQSNHTSIYHLHDMALPPPPREKLLPHPFLFPLRERRAWSGGGLGWRCANGERVHSPTHPFPALSRSIIVERWRWEPQSLPTTTPAAPPSAAAKQPPASPVYLPIYTSIHTLSHSSIKKREVVDCKEVVVSSRAEASCKKADIVSMKPFSHCCKLLKSVLQLHMDQGAYSGKVTLWMYK